MIVPLGVAFRYLLPKPNGRCGLPETVKLRGITGFKESIIDDEQWMGTDIGRKGG